jgi:hypothetical protein
MFPCYDFVIYNQEGWEIMQRKHLSRRAEVQLANQPAGFYVVKIVKDNAVIVKKILKQ